MTLELHAERYEAIIDSSTAPLVILHGLFGSSTNWRSVAKQLAEHGDVHVLDLRNHGKSPHADEMSYASMAEDVYAYLCESGLTDATLLGHSMGGKTAMTLALKRNQAIARLIVVDIPPARRHRDFSVLLDAMKTLALDGDVRRGDLDKRLKDSIAEADVRALVLQNLYRADGEYRWRINLDGIRRNLPALLDFDADPHTQRFARPTLFIVGENSDHVLPEHHPAIYQLFPDAIVTNIAAAGHWVHAEQPQAFVEHVRRFLTE